MWEPWPPYSLSGSGLPGRTIPKTAGPTTVSGVCPGQAREGAGAYPAYSLPAYVQELPTVWPHLL